MLLTQEGFDKLQNELEERKGKIRQEIALAIKEAKEQGDLSENAEYSAARQRQGENETRIAELEAMFKEAEIASKKGGAGTVQIGSQVRVQKDGKEMQFEIVGVNETDPAQGKISNESPLGSAFFGKEKGDTVSVEMPAGVSEFTIIEVK